nr:NS1 [Wongorr virus]
MTELEGFVRTFSVYGDALCSLRLCWELRDYLTCGHRYNLCRIYGVCSSQHLGYLVGEITRRGDYHAAAKLQERCEALCADREHIWACVSNWNYNGNQLELDEEWEGIKTGFQGLLDQIMFGGHLSTLRVGTRERASCYLDDAKSLLHGFFVPVSREGPFSVQFSERLGRFLICYYDPREHPLHGFISRSDDRIRNMLTTLKTELWNKHPKCKITGSAIPAHEMIFLPEMPVTTHAQKVEMLNTLDMDLKFFQSQNGREAARLFFQKFGVEGCGIADVYSLLFRTIKEDKTLCSIHVLAKHKHFDHFFMPMHLIRQMARGELDAYASANKRHLLAEWYEGDQEFHCQLCFLQGHGVERTVLIDTRDRDWGHSEGVRYARLLTCNETYAMTNPMLIKDEVLSRVGSHWVAIRCGSVRQALLTTLIVIHRCLRGGGWDSPDVRQFALFSLSRVYLHWLPTQEVAQVIFKTMCYVVLGGICDPRIERTKWARLEEFLDIVMMTDQDSQLQQDKMCAILLKTALYAFHMTRKTPCIAYHDKSQIDVIGAEPITSDGFLNGQGGVRVNRWRCFDRDSGTTDEERGGRQWERSWD